MRPGLSHTRRDISPNRRKQGQLYVGKPAISVEQKITDAQQSGSSPNRLRVDDVESPEFPTKCGIALPVCLQNLRPCGTTAWPEA